ncbi:MAG: hypothetical protein J4N90_10210 [Chloroflexi bacterium]|nr:hypothetical protein [Chloroflexota bacterium]
MADKELLGDAPATARFPQFRDRIYQMVTAEVSGLTGEQLDFESDRWEWSKWSIRRNLSHMASGDVRWLWARWGAQLFPDGLPNGEELDRLMASPHDRRLDEDLYWEPEAILEKMRLGLDLCQRVLAAETVDSLRRKVIEGGSSGLFGQYPQLFPGGLLPDARDPSKVSITLEATFLHRYYEYLTHLFNIQRLKRAQGLTAVVEIPHEGYWSMPEWDRSEP